MDIRRLGLAVGALTLASCAAHGTAPRSRGEVGRRATRGPAQHADPAVWEEQILYLVLPDRFSNGDRANDDRGQPGCFDPTDPMAFHGGDLAGLRARLPYLRDLGITAVWITPLYAQVPKRAGACGYHGYWADLVEPDDGAMEPKLGDPRDLAALAADLHAAGMKLVLDMVVNHSGRGARITRQHPDWFHDDATCAALGDPTIFCSLHGLPDFRQEDPPVASYLTAMSRGWMERSFADGIRMDTAKHVPADYFASSFVPAVRAVRGDAFLVAEVFDDGPTRHLAPVLDAGFDAAFHFALRRAMSDSFVRGKSVNAVADAVAETIGTLGEARARMLVTFLDNHDVPRFLTDAPSDDSAPARYALALAALFTLPGIPQLYSGDELAALGVYPDDRRDMPAWSWDASTRAGSHAGYAGDAAAIWSLVASLSRLRRGEPALSHGAYTELVRQPEGGPNVLAFLRSLGASSVLVALNDDTRASGAVAVPAAGRGWPDGTVLADALHRGAPAELTVVDGRAIADLPALTAGIYRVRAP